MCQENKLSTILHYNYIYKSEVKVIKVDNMLKIVSILLILSTSYLFSLEIDNRTTFNELLSHSEIYIDDSRSENISTIKNRKFEPNSKKLLGYGYSPNFDVWIRFTLTNTTDDTVQKVIEYANPLTSYVEFFEQQKLVKKDGLLDLDKDRDSLNPILEITLKPHQSKEFYIRASSKITTLIIKLTVWSPKAFEKKEMRSQVILALFFGAIGVIILYNIIICMATRERGYLYYVLFFITVSFHHLMYKGVASLYFFSSETMEMLIHYSAVIVAVPTIFLLLFTQETLRLKQYPKLNIALNLVLIFYCIILMVMMITDSYQYRSIFFMLVLLSGSWVTIYSIFKKNKQAYFIIVGWISFLSSGIFMYLSSKGIYDIFERYPFYTESLAIVEIVFFSLALAHKIKVLNQEKINSKKNSLLLKELNHRIKNSMQTILSVLILQKNRTEDKKIKEILINIENRIMATAELYSLLYIKNNLTVVNLNEYLSIISQNIKNSFKQENIKIDIDCVVTMNSEDAIYCGLIVNEAVTNAFKYAFNPLESGEIRVLLTQEIDKYHLTIKDVSLRIFHTGVAILSIELDNTKYKEFDDILRINDFGRRVYPQFIAQKDNECTTKKSFLPNYIKIGDDDKEDFNHFDYEDVPIGRHIMQVLGENIFTSKKEETQNKFYIQPSLDDRMFVMSWYGNNELIEELCTCYNYKESDKWYKYVSVDGGNDATATRHYL